MSSTAIWERVSVDAVRWAPKSLMTAAIGWGAQKPLPRLLRLPVYRLFEKLSGARLDEAELPLASYSSLGELFARRLREGVRQVATDRAAVTSPCDGTLVIADVAEHGQMIQAKGQDYSLARLLADDDLGSRLVGGSYLTIYLSPPDYHRVHSPIAAKLVGYDYIPGTFFPVKPRYSRAIDQLMTRNERVVFHLLAGERRAAVVMVGALGVSNIDIAVEPSGRVESRDLRRQRKPRRVRLQIPISIERGEELGAFRLGSTVIVVFEPGLVDLADIRTDEAVRFGEPIGRLRKDADQASPIEIVR